MLNIHGRDTDHYSLLESRSSPAFIQHSSRTPLTPSPAHANLQEQAWNLFFICQDDSGVIKAKKIAAGGLPVWFEKVCLRRTSGERPLRQR